WNGFMLMLYQASSVDNLRPLSILDRMSFGQMSEAKLSEPKLPLDKFLLRQPIYDNLVSFYDRERFDKLMLEFNQGILHVRLENNTLDHLLDIFDIGSIAIFTAHLDKHMKDSTICIQDNVKL